MIGKSLLWIAQNHSHSAAVMLKAYAKWLRDWTAKDAAEISGANGLCR